MKTIKDLKPYLIDKSYGYTYQIGDTRFEIKPRYPRKGWYINKEYKGNLVYSYGFDGQTLAECQLSVLQHLNKKP
jgi:hypothetical protein